MQRGLRLYLMGKSFKEIASTIQVNEKTVSGWSRRADWKEKTQAALQVDDEWYAEQRRQAARRASLEAFELLDDGGIEAAERIDLIRTLGKWGGLEVKRVEQKTAVSIEGMSDAELQEIIRRAADGKG
jgi:hypothetical protein